MYLRLACSMRGGVPADTGRSTNEYAQRVRHRWKISLCVCGSRELYPDTRNGTFGALVDDQRVSLEGKVDSVSYTELHREKISPRILQIHYF